MRQSLHIILSTMFVKLYLRAAGFYLKSRSWSLPKKLALALLGAALDKKALLWAAPDKKTLLGAAPDKKALLGVAPDKKPYSGRLQTKSPTWGSPGSRQKALLGRLWIQTKKNTTQGGYRSRQKKHYYYM